MELFSEPENSTGCRVISQPSFSQLCSHFKELDLVLPVSKDTVIKGGGKGEMWEELRIRFVMAKKRDSGYSIWKKPEEGRKDF